jgi:hypothetical protein
MHWYCVQCLYVYVENKIILHWQTSTNKAYWTIKKELKTNEQERLEKSKKGCLRIQVCIYQRVFTFSKKVKIIVP